MDHFSLPISPSPITLNNLIAATVGGTLSPVFAGIGGSAVTSTNSFPASVGVGKLLIFYGVVGTSTVLTNGIALTPSTSGNPATPTMVSLNIARQNTSNGYLVASGNTSVFQIFAEYWSVVKSPADFTLSGTLPTPATNGDLYIIEIPENEIPPF
jgi:hypothetical protein